MLAVLMASMLSTSEPAPPPAASLKNEPTRYCREMGSASSRGEAIKICRTRAQWLAWDACHGPTRYCGPTKRVAMASGQTGRETAFPLNEDSRIVCRTLKVTGTRLKADKVCLPVREWERMWKDSAEGALKMQDQSTRSEEIPR